MYETTRRYPRTLAEAFPDTRSYCLEVYESTWDMYIRRLRTSLLSGLAHFRGYV